MFHIDTIRINRDDIPTPSNSMGLGEHQITIKTKSPHGYGDFRQLASKRCEFDQKELTMNDAWKRFFRTLLQLAAGGAFTVLFEQIANDVPR